MKNECPFARHVRLHLSGPAKPVPDWIKRAKRNARRQARRYAKRHGCTYEEARQSLMMRAEDAAQGPDC